jgi:hypothetical protein
MVGGLRSGTTKDVADSKSVGNWFFGVNFSGPSIASGIANPIAFYYRNNKPQLGYATYGATVVVTCPASTDAPAEVYMNGRIYKNTGTVLCDLSRTIKPTAATVGGLDRGPASATHPYYIYATPTSNQSATRQWDLLASPDPPSGAITTHATFNVTSFLHCVMTGATVALERFKQYGNDIKFERVSPLDAWRLVSKPNPSTAQATWRIAKSGFTPVGCERVFVNVFHDSPNTVSQQTVSWYFGPGGVKAFNSYSLVHPISGWFGTALYSARDSTDGIITVNSTRQIQYYGGAATCSLVVNLAGWTIKRENYK